MDTNTLRQTYLNFFAKKSHKIVPSSSLVLKNDPTLLFTSAGMNQFKKEFLGQVTDFRRAATCQRCLRTDDLDMVGITAYHHTFFEMLGNFSFGDYFKQEAITYAWEFLTQDLRLRPDILWVSVYRDDEEAYDIWRKKINFPPERIVKLEAKDNFWPADAIQNGPNGPCGPCSEIFFDTSTALSVNTSTALSVSGRDSGCAKSDCRPGCGCGRFVEIWNLVFTQFNRKDGGVLEPLPNKNIDTGMGLERMASVLQGVKSNFEIDIFRPIVEAIKAYPLSAIRYPLIHAIADHIRAIVFAIYDGVIPSNEHRGYVIRKLIRKAEFCGQTIGIKEPFLYKLVPTVAATFGSVYPELKNNISEIANIINSEEKNFILTLKDASVILNKEFKDSGSKTLKAGHIAFKLHDTYGIPLEVTRDWAEKHGFEINEDDFKQDLKEQQERSKGASKLSEVIFVSGSLALGVKASKFLGYHKLLVKDAKILKIVKGAQLVRIAAYGEDCQIIVDKTPFYAESGGQTGDRGRIIKGKSIFQVEDTQKRGGIFLHCGKVVTGKFKVGDKVCLEVDPYFRQAVARAHTATHLLQAALREVLGSHIKQAGSLVESDRLRFDFIHFEKVNPEDLKRIENLVQRNILSSHEVVVKETTLSQAKKARAVAFFEDKYESRVRLVNVGDYSKELCGGTHLKNSSQIGIFKIISEGSIAKGIRRIEALTGELAWENLKQSQEEKLEIANLLKSSDDKIIPVIEDRLKKLSTLEKEVIRLRLELLKRDALSLIDEAQVINTAKLICKKYQDVGIDVLRQVADLLKSKLSSYAICLGASDNSKAWLIIVLSEDLVKKGAYASGIIKEVASFVDGDGGGRQNLAQAGGGDIRGIDKALDKFKEIMLGYLTK